MSALAPGVCGSVNAQDHRPEARSATVVLGNRSPIKARGQGLLRTLLAVCNTKAYAAPKLSNRDKSWSGVKTNPQPSLALEARGRR